METNKQYKRVPFDVELAKKIQSGEVEGKIVTRNGKVAQILSFELNHYDDERFTPLAVLLTNNDGFDYVTYFGREGRHYEQLLYIELPEETPKHEFKHFDKVLVRNNNNKWQCALFSDKSLAPDDCHIQYNTIGLGGFNECIPYEGNESLVGTTDKPKEE